MKFNTWFTGSKTIHEGREVVVPPGIIESIVDKSPSGSLVLGKA